MEYLSNYTTITMFYFFSFFTKDFYRVLWLLRPFLIDKENNYITQLGPPLSLHQMIQVRGGNFMVTDGFIWQSEPAVLHTPCKQLVIIL